MWADPMDLEACYCCVVIFSRTLTNKGWDCVGRWEVMHPGNECRGCKYTLDSRSPEWLRKYCLATCTEHLRAMVAFWFDCRKGNLKNNLSYSLSTYCLPKVLAWLSLGCVLQELDEKPWSYLVHTVPTPYGNNNSNLHTLHLWFHLWGWHLPLKCPSVDGGCWFRRAEDFMHV